MLRNYHSKVYLSLLALIMLGTSALLITPAAADGPAPSKSTAKYEIKFMQNMIDHHAMAVHMGELCIEKAIHEELRTMCEDIVTTQSQEIALMQSWLQDWYDIAYEPQMSPGAMQQMHHMAALEGAEFEIAFMEEMIRHHKGAIKEGERCVQRAYHEALRTQCENIIVTQTAETEQMQAWLCEWYGICK